MLTHPYNYISLNDWHHYKFNFFNFENDFKLSEDINKLFKQIYFKLMHPSNLTSYNDLYPFIFNIFKFKCYFRLRLFISG